MCAALAVSACGGDDAPERTTGTAATATATAAAATPTATATAAATAEPTVTLPVETPTAIAESGGGETGEGGAGDEEQIAVKLRVIVDGEGVSPETLRVAPSLPFKLIVENVLPARLSVELHERDSGFVVPGQSTHEQYYSGLPKGTYEFQFAHLDTLVLEVR